VLIPADDVAPPRLQRWLADIVSDELRRPRMTQTELAYRIGTSASRLSTILTGGKVGSLQAWDRILRELGIDLQKMS
jgi:plasmid maintenance system antidote protein VapI